MTRPSAPTAPEPEAEGVDVASEGESAAPVPLEATRAPRVAKSKPAEPAAPEEPTGQRLRVLVLDYDGEPRAGAVVHVAAAKPPRPASATTEDAEATAAPEDDKPAGLSSSANGVG